MGQIYGQKCEWTWSGVGGVLYEKGLSLLSLLPTPTIDTLQRKATEWVILSSAPYPPDLVRPVGH